MNGRRGGGRGGAVRLAIDAATARLPARQAPSCGVLSYPPRPALRSCLSSPSPRCCSEQKIRPAPDRIFLCLFNALRLAPRRR
jgi:hypothetical protein